jgi:integrase
MSVYKMASQNFRIQFMFAGKNYVRSAKTKDRRLAEAMEAKWRVELLDDKVFGKKTDILVSTLIANYLAQPLAANTVKNATSFFDALSSEVDTDASASEFDQSELHEYVVRRLKAGIKPASVRTQLLYLSAAWKLCNADIYDVPELKLPSLQPSPVKTDYLSVEDEDKLFGYLRSRKLRGARADQDFRDEVSDVFAVLLDTGARYNEIARLEWNAVDLARKTVELWRGKTKTASFIYMTDRAHGILQRRAENKVHERWVFTNWNRTSHRTDNTAYLNQVLKSAGIPHTVHTLRHTFATKMLKAGMTLNDVRVLLGHSSIQTTLRYGHLEASDASPKAVAILNEQAVTSNRANLRAV